MLEHTYDLIAKVQNHGDARMSVLTDTARTVATVLEGGGLLYSASVASAAATSLFARTAERRRDARNTLRLLVRYRFDAEQRRTQRTASRHAANARPTGQSRRR